jgi:hypothetical protein
MYTKRSSLLESPTQGGAGKRRPAVTTETSKKKKKSWVGGMAFLEASLTARAAAGLRSTGLL